MVEQLRLDLDHDGSDERLLTTPESAPDTGPASAGDQSWRLNFEGFQLSTEHKEKPRKLHDCLGVLGDRFYWLLPTSLHLFFMDCDLLSLFSFMDIVIGRIFDRALLCLFWWMHFERTALGKVFKEQEKRIVLGFYTDLAFIWSLCYLFANGCFWQSLLFRCFAVLCGYYLCFKLLLLT